MPAAGTLAIAVNRAASTGPRITVAPSHARAQAPLAASADVHRAARTTGSAGSAHHTAEASLTGSAEGGGTTAAGLFDARENFAAMRATFGRMAMCSILTFTTPWLGRSWGYAGVSCSRTGGPALPATCAASLPTPSSRCCGKSRLKAVALGEFSRICCSSSRLFIKSSVSCSRIRLHQSINETVAEHHKRFL